MLTTTKVPLTLFELKPEWLHHFWPFLRHGLEITARKMKPDWIPEDAYADLKYGNASCVISARGKRTLGFMIYRREVRPHSFKPQAFIWAAWELPIREWQEGDDIPEMFDAMWRYVNNIAISNYGADVIAWGTTVGRARAYAKKYGWKPSYVTFYIKAENGN